MAISVSYSENKVNEEGEITVVKKPKCRREAHIKYVSLYSRVTNVFAKIIVQDDQGDSCTHDRVTILRTMQHFDFDLEDMGIFGVAFVACV